MEVESDWAKVFVEHWPTAAVVLVSLFSVYHVIRFVVLTFDVSLGPLGKYWRTRRIISDTKINDMEKRITYLDGQVAALRYRDECYFAYMLADQEWHRKHELKAKEHGWDFEKHVTFLEFRDQWVSDKKFQGREHDFWM